MFQRNKCRENECLLKIVEIVDELFVEDDFDVDFDVEIDDDDVGTDEIRRNVVAVDDIEVLVNDIDLFYENYHVEG